MGIARILIARYLVLVLHLIATCTLFYGKVPLIQIELDPRKSDSKRNEQYEYIDTWCVLLWTPGCSPWERLNRPSITRVPVLWGTIMYDSTLEKRSIIIDTTPARSPVAHPARQDDRVTGVGDNMYRHRICGDSFRLHFSSEKCQRRVSNGASSGVSVDNLHGAQWMDG